MPATIQQDKQSKSLKKIQKIIEYDTPDRYREIKTGGSMTSTFLSADEAAQFLKIPKSQIYQLTFKGAIRFYKPGKRLLFRPEDLTEWVMAAAYGGSK